jgi:CubicO group peptidase (beta-lactamase class C family)
MDEKSNDKDLLKTLRSVQTIVVGVFPETSEKMLQRLDNLLGQLPHNPDVVICDFGNESFLKSASRYRVVVTGYRDHDIMIRSLPQVVFGALPAGGTLPFSITSELKSGTGLSTEALGRLTYSVPEDAKMDGRLLTRIDSIAKEAIDTRGTPGCQVFVARNGKVIYDKSFGHLTYDKKDPVTANTIYDLASVTKVTATLQTAMFMYEHGLIDLHKKVSVYLPELKKTNKKDITVIDMLTHQSGLVPFIPMYNVTVKDTVFLPLYYDRTQSEKYPLQVADRLYASPVLRDSVWSWVLKSKMGDKPVRTPYGYKYSDLGFMILQRMAERLLNQPMDDFLNQNLYEPLGATTLGFNPLTRFNKQIIAPTEDDKIYRRTHVAGTVHDERAAMLGGVAGHAGLFGTATDLGKLGQMLLQNGFYGGYQYFKPETLKLFTARKFRTSRRGIGWDKPLQSEPNGPTSMYASPLTFGHTGFTGTCIWIDPEFDLVYIFLSNRVYPDRSSKLINANIRSRIQDIIYKSIFAYEEREEPVPVVAQGLTIKAQENRPLE